MSATFTDITLTLQKWEPTETPGAFHFYFEPSQIPDKVWQDAFGQDWKLQSGDLKSTVDFRGNNLKLTLQSFLSNSLLESIKRCVKSANLAGRKHQAEQDEATRVKREEEAAQEAERKRLETVFLELKAKFNNS